MAGSPEGLETAVRARERDFQPFSVLLELSCLLLVLRGRDISREGVLAEGVWAGVSWDWTEFGAFVGFGESDSALKED